MSRLGTVYLVGAGPGDPDLITWKGRKVLAAADSVLYDHLAPVSLLELAPHGAERVYVGKKKAEHAFTQDEICEMLVQRARLGKTVVRLKGGDPFLFGRGGEEAEALADAGIPFEVMPGVSSPLGIAAYTGVPLTHREHTSVVTFVTGHAVESIDWSRVGLAETLVIFMGLSQFPAIAGQIIAHGRAPETPAMAVRWGTRLDQRTVVGTLATLPRRLAEEGLKPPATIIVGDVVALRDKLNWFEKLPLFGVRVAITRAKDQAPELSEKLRALGAETVETPSIEIQRATDYAALDASIARLETYDWLIFTSVNGVRFFLERLDASKVDLRALRARIAAIGPATRAAVEALHLKVDVMPREYIAEGLVEAFRSENLKGKRILLPRAAMARDVAPVELARMGATVDVVEAYRTVVPLEAAERLAEVFGGPGKPEWIVFTSSSTARNFFAAAPVGALEGVRIASIGPVTSATVRELAGKVTVEAEPHTVDGLVTGIVNALGKSKVALIRGGLKIVDR